jgi:RHH-type transcriptional regulator, proline utilization regulon repressor / proline dehydrogenase / delta 1-pyrroline-5-carboxylate dehydrogenase
MGETAAPAVAVAQADRLEPQVQELAREIARRGEGHRSRVFHMSWWSERLLDWAMARPDFKVQLFRLVDVFPATNDDADVMRHLEEYFQGIELPRALDLGMGAAARAPLGRSAAARVARRNILRMARQFIAGTDAAAAVPRLRQMWDEGRAFTVDLLGEKTLTEREADTYAARVRSTVDCLVQATATWPARPQLGPTVNVSVKPSALVAHHHPLQLPVSLPSLRYRLRDLLGHAHASGAFLNVDMEHHDVSELTRRAAQEVMDDDQLAGAPVGVVVQAYRRDSYVDLREVIAWSAGRCVPVTVRLVKGAYWDAETIWAQAAGWPVPVFSRKDHSDANFDRCARLLLDNHPSVRAAFASHNLRSLAHAITYARGLGIPDDAYEIQMLYGMAEPIHAAIAEMGFNLRVYTPVGELVPGMAYLVRRLLENTSNDSFVRHRFAEGVELDELLAPPPAGQLPGPTRPAHRSRSDAADPTPYRPEPVAEWRRPEVRRRFGLAVSNACGRGPRDVPAVIGGEAISGTEWVASTDPADPQRTVARAASCTVADADAAVAAARDASDEWGRWPAQRRADVLFGAADWLRRRRFEVAALEVFEAGKPWDQADADVAEAIDFCEYYGREALRLEQGGAVQSPPGERNELRYGPKGVVAVIAPWNFPLAIPTGMTTAALAAGNTVVLKPAEQTPAVASCLLQALQAAGLPAGALNLLPGPGESVGARLVEHHDVAMVAFTGSLATGLEINRVAALIRPGQRQVKRVIAEMGGKNALIVDSDADLDEAVPAIVESAFGFSGQKCSAASRLVAVGRVHDELVARVAEVTAELIVGPPVRMEVQVGPLIDADALAKVRQYLDMAARDGTIVTPPRELPTGGWFAAPTVVCGLGRDHPVARDEIFGPVLVVLTAEDLVQALEIATDTDYGLTAGIFSRSPANIALATDRLRAGNVYVNRSITGAVVGRQPFGGVGLSGVGSKAGGPDYVVQFADPRAISENTLRQGFAPESPL